MSRVAVAALAAVIGLVVPQACGDETKRVSDDDDGSGGSGGSVSSSQGGEPSSCVGDPCKLTAPQCGCPEGQMCEYVSGVIECIVAGSDQLGEECTPYSCGTGLHCLQTFGPPLSCHAWCDSDADCDGARCLVGVGDGVGGVFTQRLCGTACDPITSTGCGLAGSKCALLLSLSPQQWYTACSAAGPGGDSTFCSDSGDCISGHHCVNEICRPYCLPNGPSCPAGLDCLSFDPPSVIDGVSYGVCVGS